MKTLKIIIGIIVGLVAFTTAKAQSQEVAKEKLIALTPLVGEWSGGGWMITPQRKKMEFSQKESIDFTLNGSVLLIQGKGRTLEGELIHNALAVVSYDQHSNEIIMQSYLEDGRQTRAQMLVDENGLITWWFKTSENSTIKYTIDVRGNTWTEKGEYSPDGFSWFPFIQFTLEKG